MSHPADNSTSSELSRRAWLNRTATLAGGALAGSLLRPPAALGASTDAAAKGAPTRAPNVLWIMVDEWRADAFGFEKHHTVQTPHLDQLAREGTRFANCYTASPVCSPSRACAFTGRYAHINGVTGNSIPARDGEVYLPSILGHYGYDTAISGKLHFRPKQMDFGFREFWSLTDEAPDPARWYPTYLTGKHGPKANRGSIRPGTCPFPGDEIGKQIGIFPYPEEDFENEYVTRHALDYLRRQKAATQPFFLFASYNRPHSPFNEPEKWFNLYDRKSVTIPDVSPEIAQLLTLKIDPHARRVFIANEKLLRELSAVYYAACSHVDDEIGRLLAELEAQGLADDTIVVFCADHGQMLGDRGRMFKSLMWEGSARVPLVIRGPRRSRTPNWREGAVRQEVVELHDVFPTLFEMCGLPMPEGVQGRSLLPLADGRGGATWRNEACSWLSSRAMFRTQRYKFIKHDDVDLLYDMVNDPAEERNLISTPSGRALADDLRKTLAARRAAIPPPMRIPGMSLPAYAQLPPEVRRKQRGGNAREN